MLIAALVLAGLAAALHVYIWAMEALWWQTPRVRSTFGTTEEFAASTRGLALNQGFYNLFLAVVAGAGIVASALDQGDVGAALIFAGVGSMFAAAVVLVVSDPTKASAALKQGVVPLGALVVLCLSLAF